MTGHNDRNPIDILQPARIAVVSRKTLGDDYARVCGELHLDPTNPVGYGFVMGYTGDLNKVTLLLPDPTYARQFALLTRREAAGTALPPGFRHDDWLALPAAAIVRDYDAEDVATLRAGLANGQTFTEALALDAGETPAVRRDVAELAAAFDDALGEALDAYRDADAGDVAALDAAAGDLMRANAGRRIVIVGPGSEALGAGRVVHSLTYLEAGKVVDRGYARGDELDDWRADLTAQGWKVLGPDTAAPAAPAVDPTHVPPPGVHMSVVDDAGRPVEPGRLYRLDPASVAPAGHVRALAVIGPGARMWGADVAIHPVRYYCGAGAEMGAQFARGDELDQWRAALVAAGYAVEDHSDSAGDPIAVEVAVAAGFVHVHADLFAGRPPADVEALEAVLDAGLARLVGPREGEGWPLALTDTGRAALVADRLTTGCTAAMRAQLGRIAVGAVHSPVDITAAPDSHDQDPGDHYTRTRVAVMLDDGRAYITGPRDDAFGWPVHLCDPTPAAGA